jgi:hypothetical protein
MDIQLCITGEVASQNIILLATDLVTGPIIGFTVSLGDYYTITFNIAEKDAMLPFIDILEANKMKLEQLMTMGATCIFIQCFHRTFKEAGGLIVYGDCDKNLYYFMNFREFGKNLHINCPRCRDTRRPEVKTNEFIFGHQRTRSINASRFETPSLWEASRKVVDARAELKGKVSKGFSEIRNRLMILPELKSNLELANMEYTQEEDKLREFALVNIDKYFESDTNQRPVYPPLKEDEVLTCMCNRAYPLVMPSGNEPIFRE